MHTGQTPQQSLPLHSPPHPQGQQEQSSTCHSQCPFPCAPFCLCAAPQHWAMGSGYGALAGPHRLGGKWGHTAGWCTLDGIPFVLGFSQLAWIFLPPCLLIFYHWFFVFWVFFFDHFFLSPANFYSNMEGWGLSIGKAGEASRRSKSSGPSSPPSFPNQPCRAKGFQGQIQAAKEEEKCLPCQPVHHSGKRPLVPSPQNCYVRMKSGSCSFPCVILVQCPNAKIPSNGALSTPGFGPSGRVLGSITLHCSPLPWAARDTVYAPFGKGFQPSHSHPKGAFPAIKL